MNIIKEGESVYVFPLPAGVYDIFIREGYVAKSLYKPDLVIIRKLRRGNLIVSTPTHSSGFLYNGKYGAFKVEKIEAFVRAYNDIVGYTQDESCFTFEMIMNMDKATIQHVLAEFDLEYVKKNPSLLTARWKLLDTLAKHDGYLSTHLKAVVKHPNFKSYMVEESEIVVIERYREREIPVFVPMNDFVRRYLLAVTDFMEQEKDKKVTDNPLNASIFPRYREYLDPLIKVEPLLKEYFGLEPVYRKMEHASEAHTQVNKKKSGKKAAASTSSSGEEVERPKKSKKTAKKSSSSAEEQPKRPRRKYT